MKFYCGIDLGARSSHVNVLDQKEASVLDRQFVNDLETFKEALLPLGKGLSCVVECTFNWPWLVYGLQNAGIEMHLAHALGLTSISGAKVKTDRRDARTLARLLRAGMIPEAYIYPEALYPVRALVRDRSRLVAKRASCYSSLRCMLYEHGILEHSRNGIKNFGTEDLEQYLEHPLVRLHGRQLLARIQAYTVQVTELESTLLNWPGPDLDLRRLQTVPGIGAVLSLIIYYETGDITRFESARHYASYCRVVPGIAQSGPVSRRGRGSKQGNAHLKGAFTEAAVFARRYAVKPRRYYERCLARHTGRGQKLIANNAVAHKLCMAVYNILIHKCNYKEDKLF